MEGFRAIFALVAAGPLFFGHALAQDAEQEQEPPAQQDAGSESAPVNTPADDASDEDGAGAEGRDPDGAGDADSAPGADPGIDPAFDPDVYDPELDDQTYEGDDDIFVPTEEIPADEPIPFPSDI